MSGKLASLMFLGVCIALGIGLLVKLISPVLGALLFAVALVLLGVASKGFGR